MKQFLEMLSNLGVTVDDSASNIVLLALYYLVLSIFILLNVVNISVYLLSIYILSHEKLLNRIPENYVFLRKLISYSKNIRIGFILTEVFLLIICLLIMIILSYSIVSFYIHYKYF